MQVGVVWVFERLPQGRKEDDVGRCGMGVGCSLMWVHSHRLSVVKARRGTGCCLMLDR